MNNQGSSGNGPLGSLRDLINEKTGNTGTGHSSSLTQGNTSSSTGADYGRGLASSTGNRDSSAATGGLASGMTGNAGTTASGRDTFGQQGLGTNSSTTDPSSIGVASSIRGSNVATGMAGNTGTSLGGNNTMGQNSLGSTSNTSSTNPFARGVASATHNSTPTTGMTGHTGSAIGGRDTLGQGFGESSSTYGTGTGSSSIYTASSNEARDGHASSTVERAEQKLGGGGGPNAAAGMGVGTGEGLAGSYDFLRTHEGGPNTTDALDTNGPAHIAPPPGSREPPVSTSNNTSTGGTGRSPFA